MAPDEFLTNPALKQEVSDYITEFHEKTNIEVFKKLKHILNMTFGEENNQISKPTLEDYVDFLVSQGYSSSSYEDTHRTRGNYYKVFMNSHIHNRVIILFPDITITNTNKETHNIKELYVSFKVDNEGRIKGGLHGTRGAMTNAEMLTGYGHSHLYTLDLNHMNFQRSFCLGEGPIVQVMSLLGQEWSEVNFSLFCLHLKSYVAWESQEGGPYQNMVNIGIRGGNGQYSLTSRDITKIADYAMSVIFTKWDDTHFSSYLNYEVTEKGVNVTVTEEGEIALGEIVIMIPRVLSGFMSGFNMENLRSFRGADGAYMSVVGNSAQVTVWQTTPQFKFKGKDVILKKITNGQEQEEKTKKQKYANPSITSEICKRISNSFTKTLITTEDIYNEPATIHIGKVAETDIVSMCE